MRDFKKFAIEQGEDYPIEPSNMFYHYFYVWVNFEPSGKRCEAEFYGQIPKFISFSVPNHDKLSE